MATATDQTAPTRDAAPACAHCGLAVPRALVDAAASRQFCCAGCRAVHETISACGLEDYYRLRAAADAAAAPADLPASGHEAFDSPAFAARHVRALAGDVRQCDLLLEGVHCAACVWLLERLPRAVDGVLDARLSLRERLLRVTWDERRVTLGRIARTVERFGYRPHAARGGGRRELLRREERRRLVRLGAAGAIAGNVMLLAIALYAGMFGGMERQTADFFRWISLALGMTSLLWPGAEFFRSALSALRARSVNLDVPICLALVAGGVAGLVNVVLGRGEIYFDTLAVLVFLLLIGRFFQHRQQRRADDAVELLFCLTPSTCRIVRDGRTVEQPIDALETGDLVEVRSGDVVPADGVVQSGRSTLSLALLSGESRPVEAGEGDEVYAGCANAGGVLRVRVTAVAEQTRVGRLMRLVEQGIRDKPPIVQFTDRVGAWFVVAVSLAGAGVFAFWSGRSMAQAIDHSVALLIVTCPCVLGLATPLTFAVAIGRLARRGILVKSASALERLARGGRLLLDKTGTITEGRLSLVRWVGEASIRGAVGRIETASTHPVARALAEALADEAAGVEAPRDVREIAGGGMAARVAEQVVRVGSPAWMASLGVSVEGAAQAAVDEAAASGRTVALAAVGRRAVAAAVLEDEARPDSRAAVAMLRAGGWSPTILSGDLDAAVQRVAAQVGLAPEEARGNVSPEAKLQFARRRDDGATLMVGDGVNDAAALAAADVGVAVQGGAEASLAAADVYIATPGLMPLVELTATARRTMRTVRANLGVSLAYNLLAGALAATGLMSPLLAAILMPLSSATVLSLAAASLGRETRSGSEG